MTNYEHNRLLAQLASLDQPPDDAARYATWLAAGAHLDLLRQNAKADDIIMYASGPCSFVHALAVSEDTLDPLRIDDLLGWAGNPFLDSSASYTWGGGRDDVWIERDSPVHGSKTLKSARPFLFGRTIEGLPGRSRQYMELLQEYAHLSEIHYYPEHSSYCRFGDDGELEPMVTITLSSTGDDISLVTFRRNPLERYLAASGSALVRMFDFMLLRRAEFTSWSDAPAEIVKRESIVYQQKIDAGVAAYARGVQILRTKMPHSKIFSSIKEGPLHDRRYADFVARDLRTGDTAIISTDPSATTNYFEAKENSLPLELSPAFFRPEVLAKYKNDADKYVIDSRRIDCRGAWSLRGYDVNEAGQIHAYICDLRELPYSEQLYWKSFNEPPKGNISKRALTNDFLGEWTELIDPVDAIKQLLDGWHQEKAPWWSCRDPSLPSRVVTPRTGSRDEWAREVKNLAMLIIEGFEVKALRGKLDEMKVTWDSADGSLMLLERLLAGRKISGGSGRLGGLRSIQRIRSKVDSHVRGAEALQMANRAVEEHGTYTAHFESVCATVRSELRAIAEAWKPGSTAAHGTDKRS